MMYNIRQFFNHLKKQNKKKWAICSKVGTRAKEEGKKSLKAKWFSASLGPTPPLHHLQLSFSPFTLGQPLLLHPWPKLNGPNLPPPPHDPSPQARFPFLQPRPNGQTYPCALLIPFLSLSGSAQSALLPSFFFLFGLGPFISTPLACYSLLT